jgi:hypothetical protein
VLMAFPFHSSSALLSRAKYTPSLLTKRVYFL